jgi:NDP-sugar pyrophosphorylase family protein
MLSGGLGTSLRPFTEAMHRQLLPIGEKAALEIQSEHLKANGFNQVFLATNYRLAYIEYKLKHILDRLGLPHEISSKAMVLFGKLKRFIKGLSSCWEWRL